jgi:hypothetical protein
VDVWVLSYVAEEVRCGDAGPGVKGVNEVAEAAVVYRVQKIPQQSEKIRHQSRSLTAYLQLLCLMTAHHFSEGLPVFGQISVVQCAYSPSFHDVRTAFPLPLPAANLSKRQFFRVFFYFCSFDCSMCE